jgi:hypothetical protein
VVAKNALHYSVAEIPQFPIYFQDSAAARLWNIFMGLLYL